MPKPVLVIMTRWHAPYRCKRRLAQEIGAEQAALIQKKLTIHTISVAKTMQKKGFIDLRLAIEGIGFNKIKQVSKALGIKDALPQGEGNLGVKMKRQVQKIQKRNVRNNRNGLATIIIGTDLPSLCELDLIQALKKLDKADMVLGPAQDGGYWLLGLAGKSINPLTTTPFDGIKWGTSSVLKQTITKAKKKGICYELVNYKNDLDQIEDLEPWLKSKDSQDSLLLYPPSTNLKG